LDSRHLVLELRLRVWNSNGNLLYTVFSQMPSMLVAYGYGSDNNVVSKRLVKKLHLPTSSYMNQGWVIFTTMQCVTS